MCVRDARSKRDRFIVVLLKYTHILFVFIDR